MLGFLAVAFVVGCLVYYRKAKLLKASQVPMLAIIVSSLMVACVRIALATQLKATNATCVARYWIGHLAYSCVPAMLAKTLRVHLIVNAKSLKKVKITTAQVVAFTLSLVFVTVVIMAFLTPLNSVSVHSFFTTAVNGVSTFRYQCVSDNWKLDFILYSYEMLLLVIAFKLCYDTRKVRPEPS